MPHTTIDGAMNDAKCVFLDSNNASLDFISVQFKKSLHALM